ncbi:fungal-specific transcription factor domain-containing protein [Mycena maculata]|uniref:Fungal-specific transcription factor domain-containing protein n=1 Tax=Mycena maculata TaxID=230809 RepID=A0AAD7IW38_9AGAR|nr:fungal-specific transcription factor domain-containing protein [Mycena maculata]
MSSNDEEYGHDFHRGKKRRIQRACDVCRRRKSRCDGSQMPGDKCSTCIDADLDCTYLEAATKRVPVRTNYVESLETRLEHAEALIRHLRTELATAHFNLTSSSRAAGAGSPPTHNSPASTSSNNDAGSAPEAPLPTGITGATLEVMRTALRSLTGPPPPPNAEDLLHLEIARKLEKLAIGKPKRHFIGKSSGAALVKAAIDLKADVRRVERRAGSEDSPNPGGRAYREAQSPDGTAYWGNGAPNGANGHGNGHGQRQGSGGGERDDEAGAGSDSESEDGEVPPPWTSRRMKFWTFKPWENTAPRTVAYSFPPPDLAADLTELYFTHVNAFIPLLHRPTFERSVRDGLHLEDDSFAAILLLVCAVASRWSDDPRVSAPGGHEGVGKPSGGVNPDSLACGWGWFDQVPLVGRHLFGQATLYDLQYYCLAVQFLEGSSAPQACWTLIGVGIRLAQDVGAHRRTPDHDSPSVERELWKRAFWVLVYMDRAQSAATGRACAIQYDDFDLDFPLECDDEYWEHPTRPFQQPTGVPSRVAFFNSLLRLNNILAFSLKILYPLNKVKVAFSISEHWEEHVVAELDSALNRWRDEVPAHLRWDPLRANSLFFDQSVALHSAYYHLQILIHRPFIPMVRKSAPTALPSLAICTSAARACANMVDIQRRRKGKVPVVFNLPAVFTSGLVLLLNVWSGKRTGLVPDPSREIANVNKCMEVVRLCEDRWQSAGLLWDILSELASVGRLPLPNPNAHVMTVNDCDHSQQSQRISASTKHPPPLPRGTRYPSCHFESMPPEDTSRIMLGSRGLRQTFDRPISDAQFRAPYAQPQPASFAGEIGMGVSGGGLGIAPMEPSAFAPNPPPNTWFPPEDPFANMVVNPGQATRELDDMMSLIDSDTIAMWTNAPTGFEVDDWGNYFSNFSEITQGQPIAHSGMGMNGHGH